MGDIFDRSKPNKLSTRDELPADVADAVRSAQARQIYPVAGFQITNDQIIKADDISFAADSALVFNNLNYPFLVICARRLLFSAPRARTTIARRMDIQSAGARDGQRGYSPPIKGGGGANGDAGGEGGAGEDGHGIASLPHVFLMTDEIVEQPGSPQPVFVNLSVLFPGIDGSNGGRGGDGGNGADGTGGEAAKDNEWGFGCDHGGGNGGYGGPGGVGGRGGNGGQGGNGASVWLVGSTNALNVLQFSNIANDPGMPGRGGEGGRPGHPGGGGGGGSGSHFCSGGNPGGAGPPANPPSRGQGSDGALGLKGYVFRKEFLVSSLF